MADEKQQPKEHNAFRRILSSFFFDVILFGAAKSLWRAIADVVIAKPAKKAVEGQSEEKHQGDKHVFAEAISSLAFQNPEAATTIRGFMVDELHNLDERNDFLINAAKTGEGVKGTSDFLLALAGLPTHDDRRKFLENISYIGEGEQSFSEKHAVTLEHAQRYLEDSTRRAYRRNSASDHDRFWSNYKRLRQERKRGKFKRAFNKTLDILFAR